MYLLCLSRGACWASLPAGQRGQTDGEGGAAAAEDEGAGEGIGGGETAPVDERGGRGSEDTGHCLGQDGGGFLCRPGGSSAATARPAVEGSSRTHQQSALLHGHPDEVSLVNYWGGGRGEGGDCQGTIDSLCGWVGKWQTPGESFVHMEPHPT